MSFLVTAAIWIFFGSDTLAQLAISNSPGFVITWDGNNGVNPTPPNVPTNLALATQGAVAYASGQLGPQAGLNYHYTTNLNDGVYGNNRSWIGGDGDPAPWFAGIQLPSSTPINGIAWGRDNMGLFSDRSIGTYTLQFSTNATFTTNLTAWTTLGTVTLNNSVAGFNPWLRHYFGLALTNGDPISATALRIIVPSSGFAGVGVAIDELELFAEFITPTLTLVPIAPDNVIISWSPDTPGFVLQENLNLDITNWVSAPSGNTNAANLPALAPGKFYRLFKP